jgi:hypothetical protein
MSVPLLMQRSFHETNTFQFVSSAKLAWRTKGAKNTFFVNPNYPVFFASYRLCVKALTNCFYVFTTQLTIDFLELQPFSNAISSNLPGNSPKSPGFFRPIFFCH